jgi:hypothetical protein
VEGKGKQHRGMEEAPENGKELSHSAHANGMNESNTGRFIMFSVITNIYNKKTKGPTLMELFTATGILKKFFLTTRDVRCVHHR